MLFYSIAYTKYENLQCTGIIASIFHFKFCVPNHLPQIIKRHASDRGGNARQLFKHKTAFEEQVQMFAQQCLRNVRLKLRIRLHRGSLI